MLNRLPPKAVWWISLIGMLLACTLLVIAADRSDAATGVATKSEYRQLRNGMTYAQVVRLFNAPRHKIASSPYEVLVVGNPPRVYAGAYAKYEWYTGRADRYDWQPGRACWAITTDFYRDASGTYRLRAAEDDSNTCTTKENP